jgi:ElaB/YqjD/DUF883 family membrane-anchored ribosome-binding protein
MGINDVVVDKTRETAAEFQGSGTTTGFGNVKTIIADKLHNVAEALGEIAAEQDENSGPAHYSKQASDWLDHSAEQVRQFDYKQADARVREYVRQNPGRSLLFAGAVGLIVGALLRRR